MAPPNLGKGYERKDPEKTAVSQPLRNFCSETRGNLPRVERKNGTLFPRLVGIIPGLQVKKRPCETNSCYKIRRICIVLYIVRTYNAWHFGI